MPFAAASERRKMADPIKFVQLDCHLDEKFEYIEAEFGLEGFAIIVKLFQRIYGGQGYYCEWSDRVALLFARKIGAGANVVREVVSHAPKFRRMYAIKPRMYAMTVKMHAIRPQVK